MMDFLGKNIDLFRLNNSPCKANLVLEQMRMPTDGLVCGSSTMTPKKTNNVAVKRIL